MSRTAKRPDVQAIRKGLKDFQLRSVDYVLRRLYEDPDAVDRFLLADEVGLGKTLVAKGVVAHAVDRLWDEVPRIDVVYVCSNAAIARQNVERLRFGADDEFDSASRMTLLPLHVRDLAERKLNRVALTPATSFDLRGNTGVKLERLLIHHLLSVGLGIRSAGLRNVLRANVSRDHWLTGLQTFATDLRCGERHVDDRLAQAFVTAVAREERLRAELEALCQEFGHDRSEWPQELSARRNDLVGRLRRVLARVCINELQPDFVILDEFQRFKSLLLGDAADEDEREMAQLAKEFFEYRTPEGRRTKVLLLSATPYKMYTVAGEDEDHYRDFVSTARFLLESEAATKELEDQLERYRDALCAAPASEAAGALRREIEARLRRVMCRTERLGVTADRNGMVADHSARTPNVAAADVAAWQHLERVARHLEAGDHLELWKSAPYLLNLMDEGYHLKSRLRDCLKKGDTVLESLLQEARTTLLDREAVDRFDPIEPANARMRDLLERAVLPGWRLLWIPAAMPYYEPGGPFAEEGVRGFTKTLVFSNWQVVPKAIAFLCSYEAERHMARSADASAGYRTLVESHRGLLRFATDSSDGGRLSGMPVFALVYPCVTLARDVDPLAIARELRGSGQTVTAEAVLSVARGKIRALLKEDAARAPQAGRPDKSWYWAAPFLLDKRFAYTAMRWVWDGGSAMDWEEVITQDEDGTLFHQHLEEARQAARCPDLGPMPADLADVLALMALGSPAVTLLRALMRQWPKREQDSDLLAGAAVGAMGFRALYNRPAVTALLRGLGADQPYWMQALNYGVAGNLQAVLDEYAHALRDHLGLQGRRAGERGDPDDLWSTPALQIGFAVEEAASIGATRISFDDLRAGPDGRVAAEPVHVRCRYAMRFGQGKEPSDDVDGQDHHDDRVRNAFNSPFRPFILATTSVGQEGLDFHLYCHSICHWNLPSNPVELEQREGRIHRYKGHVIRRNVAHGGPPADGGADPWAALYAGASASRSESTDLIPFWVCEGPHRIERHVPLLPLSREEGHLPRLKREMALYRLVFGQPRQEDLLRLLAEKVGESVGDVRIDLSPSSPKGTPNLQWETPER